MTRDAHFVTGLKGTGFNIELENLYEYHTIFYSEVNIEKQSKELIVKIDFVRNMSYYLPFFRPTVILRTNSLKSWNNTHEALSSLEYLSALSRIYKFLLKCGFRVHVDDSRESRKETTELYAVAS